METLYFNKLKRLISKLNKSEGHFIILNGSFTPSQSKDTDVFCQLYKNRDTSTIIIEAVSHHFNPTLSKNLKLPFSKLGFIFDDNGFYSKEVILNSAKDVTNIALEIQEIFENIFKAAIDSKYNFDDQIEVRVSPEKASAIQPAPANAENTQPNNIQFGCGLLFIISIIFFVIFTVLDTDNSTNTESSEYVTNSKWDKSVYQVEYYIKKHYLADPESLSVMEWGDVIKMDDVRKLGHPSYVVTLRYRAKNALGNYVIESKIVSLDFKGNIIEFLDLPMK